MKIIYQRLLPILFFSAIFSNISFCQSNEIMVVGGGDDADPRVFDQSIVDSLISWGYTASYMNQNTFQNAGADVYDGLVGIFFGESISSSAVPRFGPGAADDGDYFPLPFIVMEPSAPAKSAEDSGWGIPITVAASNGNAGDGVIEIVEKNHYVTNNYEAGDLVTYSNAETFSVTGVLYETESYFDNVLAKLSNEAMSGVLSPEGATSEHFLLAAKDFSTEIPVRSFFWSVTSANLDGEAIVSSGSPTLATSEFYSLMKRAAEWTYLDAELENKVITSYLETGYYQLKVYHDVNPNRILVGYHAVDPVNVVIKLLDLSGKELETLKEGISVIGKNFVGIDRSKYSQGTYLIRLESNLEIKHSLKIFVR